MNKKVFIAKCALSLVCLLPGWAAEDKVTIVLSAPEGADYQAKDYSHLLGMPGFSDQLLKIHFQLYQGYVKNVNLLKGALRDKTPDFEYGALKRRWGWEFDGMRLHELYFDNLGGKKESLEKNTALYQRIVKDFGSYEQWKTDFIATGSMRGIGWAILYRDPQGGRLMNVWINEHDLGHLAGGDPLLVMDVFEHAYMPQYGLERGKYIDAFFENIQWNLVAKRLDAASKP